MLEEITTDPFEPEENIYDNPVFLVISKEAVLLLVFSYLMVMIGIANQNLLFILPSIIYPIILVILIQFTLSTKMDDFKFEVAIPSVEVKAKSIIPVNVKVITNTNPISGILSIDVSDGLFPVQTPQQAVINTRIKAGTTFLFLAPIRGKEAIYRLNFQFQGILGLFYKEKNIIISKEIIVVPEPQRVKLPWTMRQKILDLLVSQISLPVKGRGTDFFALRDFLPNDEVRHIHWKASAKQDKLIVKEFEEPMTLRFLIVIDSSLMMAGPKLEFALSSAVELATVIRRSHHSLTILVHGDSFSKMIHLGNSLSALRTIAMELHSIKAEGTQFNFQTLRDFIRDHKLTNTVMIFLSDTELQSDAVRAGLNAIKRYAQAIFYMSCYSPGFGTLALAKVRDERFYSHEQFLYRSEIIEPFLEREYRGRIEEYIKAIEGRNSRFKLIKSYNTNILLELREMLINYQKASSRKIGAIVAAVEE